MVLLKALLHDNHQIVARSSSIFMRLLVAASQPVLWFTLVLAFVWLSLRPSRRWVVQSFRRRKAAKERMGVALWRAAESVLVEGPYLVIAMLLIGAVIGLLVGDVRGVPWGLAAAVIGASLAPVVFEPPCDPGNAPN